MRIVPWFLGWEVLWDMIGFKAVVIPKGTSHRVGCRLRNCRREATYKSLGCRLYRDAELRVDGLIY